VVMPAAAIEPVKKLWRTKASKSKHGKTAYLFNHKALATVFRAKLLAAITAAGLTLPVRYPKTWVVDCKSVGSGDKALVYLGRYLYRGVIREKDIVACKNGQVTFRYQNSKSKRYEFRTLPGAQFLWLILQHILPKGFRRARNFGFLHPNSKRLIQILQYRFGVNINRALGLIKQRPQWLCPCCNAKMKIIKTQIPVQLAKVPLSLEVGGSH